MLIIFLSRTEFSDYTRCGDEVLREIMVLMAIDPFLNVRSIAELLQSVPPERKDVDRYMINNVRLRAHRKN